MSVGPVFAALERSVSRSVSPASYSGVLSALERQLQEAEEELHDECVVNKMLRGLSSTPPRSLPRKVCFVEVRTADGVRVNADLVVTTGKASIVGKKLISVDGSPVGTKTEVRRALKGKSAATVEVAMV